MIGDRELNIGPLRSAIGAWRDMNDKRAMSMKSPDAQQVKDINDQELYLLRDIAGEAMQLLDEIDWQAGEDGVNKHD